MKLYRALDLTSRHWIWSVIFFCRLLSLAQYSSILVLFLIFVFQLNIETVNGEEFYEIYKGVVAEYQSMVTELCSGPCMALEITGKGIDTPTIFRELCGPADPVRVYVYAEMLGQY